MMVRSGRHGNVTRRTLLLEYRTLVRMFAQRNCRTREEGSRGERDGNAGGRSSSRRAERRPLPALSATNDLRDRKPVFHCFTRTSSPNSI